MQAAQASFQTAIETCTTLYNNMMEQQSTLAANWTGETASAFGQALEAWLNDFQTVNTALQGFLTTMNQNTGVYLTTQDANQQAASTILSDTSALAGAMGLPALG
jgi:WXG100 family type VII secretion target